MNFYWDQNLKQIQPKIYSQTSFYFSESQIAKLSNNPIIMEEPGFPTMKIGIWQFLLKQNKIGFPDVKNYYYVLIYGYS